MSYKAEFIADTSGEWAGNDLRFETQYEAEVYAADKASEWVLVERTRVVQSEEPVNARWEGWLVYL